MVINMQRWLISYADNRFLKQQRNLKVSAKIFAPGVNLREYSPDSIDEVFYERNKKILSAKKGGGYWLWKPYIILRTLKEMEYGDVLLYMDSGSILVKNAGRLFESLEAIDQDVVGFETPFLEKEYTKSATIEAILADCDEENKAGIIEDNQVQATFQFVRKSDSSMNFYSKLLELSENEHLICDGQSEKGEVDSFVAHRHDQSIFSLLYRKYGYIAYRDITQFGVFPEYYERSFSGRMPRERCFKTLDSSRTMRIKDSVDSLGCYVFIYRSRKLYRALADYFLWRIKVFLGGCRSD